ncbi:MAG: hypothetical protein M0R46_13915 [Candidatus Muirbacterium halophilum]|nr:hypothetical protein [Candidatus Muirbacterium halophilum]
MKSIKISSKVHSELKIHCVKNKITLSNFVEKIINKELRKTIKIDDTNKKD